MSNRRENTKVIICEKEEKEKQTLHLLETEMIYCEKEEKDNVKRTTTTKKIWYFICTKIVLKEVCFMIVSSLFFSPIEFSELRNITMEKLTRSIP